MSNGDTSEHNDVVAHFQLVVVMVFLQATPNTEPAPAAALLGYPTRLRAIDQTKKATSICVYYWTN